MNCNFIAQKLLYLFVTLFLVVSLTFALIKAIPGDPFTDEKGLSKEIHLALRKHYGLEDAWTTQYAKFVWSAFTFNLGPSFKYQGRSVNSIISETFPISATLGLEALILALSVGVTCGVLSALKQNQWQDRTLMILATLGLSVPSFILAVFLQYTFAMKLGIFPLARWGTFMQCVLPAIALAAMPMAYIARLVRSNMIEVLKADYIKTAHSKGLSPTKIVFKHALKNSLIPLIPYFGQLTAGILLGSFVIEKIFGIPGLGQWFVMSVSNRDYPLIMATTIFYSFILLSCVFLADLLQMILDPRVRQRL